MPAFAADVQLLALDAHVGPGGHGHGDKGVAANHGVVAYHGLAAQNRSPGINGHVVFNGRVTFPAAQVLLDRSLHDRVHRTDRAAYPAAEPLADASRRGAVCSTVKTV